MARHIGSYVPWDYEDNQMSCFKIQADSLQGSESNHHPPVQCCTFGWVQYSGFHHLLAIAGDRLPLETRRGRIVSAQAYSCGVCTHESIFVGLEAVPERVSLDIS